MTVVTFIPLQILPAALASLMPNFTRARRDSLIEEEDKKKRGGKGRGVCVEITLFYSSKALKGAAHRRRRANPRGKGAGGQESPTRSREEVGEEGEEYTQNRTRAKRHS